MSGPIFFSEQFIIELHEELLEAHGGLPGMDYGKVCGLAAFPQNKYLYNRPTPTIPQIAAQYAFAANTFHAFTDGNKRVSLSLMEIFLVNSGYQLTSSEQETEYVILGLASGEIGLDDMEAWVAENVSEFII